MVTGGREFTSDGLSFLCDIRGRPSPECEVRDSKDRTGPRVREFKVANDHVMWLGY